MVSCSAEPETYTVNCKEGFSTLIKGENYRGKSVTATFNMGSRLLKINNQNLSPAKTYNSYRSSTLIWEHRDIERIFDLPRGAYSEGKLMKAELTTREPEDLSDTIELVAFYSKWARWGPTADMSAYMSLSRNFDCDTPADFKYFENTENYVRY